MVCIHTVQVESWGEQLIPERSPATSTNREPGPPNKPHRGKRSALQPCRHSRQPTFSSSHPHDRLPTATSDLTMIGGGNGNRNRTVGPPTDPMTVSQRDWRRSRSELAGEGKKQRRGPGSAGAATERRRARCRVRDRSRSTPRRFVVRSSLLAPASPEPRSYPLVHQG